MKKEHWLYVVIAVLVLWIIVSYMSAPKAGAPTNSNTTDTSSINLDSKSDTSVVIPAKGNVGTESGVTGSSEVVSKPNTGLTSGMSAGPNRGVFIEAGIPASASITAQDQAEGSMVTIAEVKLTVSGWVVVREELNGQMGNVLGAQRFDAGSYAGGQVELARGMVAGARYYALVYADDGDRMFDHKLDQAYLQNGALVMSAFKAF